MFEQEISAYESLRQEHHAEVTSRMDQRHWAEYNEVLFSTHSCAIEGNTFTVDDSRILREKGMAMVPAGHTLLECAEIADHFRAFDYVATHLDSTFDETLLKQANRLVTEHTIGYLAPGTVPGDYTTEDMAAGDTIFGRHEELVARVPQLMSATQNAIDSGTHPMVVAARWHGYFIYLHPFRDGNGRTGRLMSNFILMKAQHPLVIIPIEKRAEYISALKAIRQEGTDEYLTAFFFKTAMERMQEELEQKSNNTNNLFIY